MRAVKRTHTHGRDRRESQQRQGSQGTAKGCKVCCEPAFLIAGKSTHPCGKSQRGHLDCIGYFGKSANKQGQQKNTRQVREMPSARFNIKDEQCQPTAQHNGRKIRKHAGPPVSYLNPVWRLGKRKQRDCCCSQKGFETIECTAPKRTELPGQKVKRQHPQG